MGCAANYASTCSRDIHAASACCRPSSSHVYATNVFIAHVELDGHDAANANIHTAIDVSSFHGCLPRNDHAYGDHADSDHTYSYDADDDNANEGNHCCKKDSDEEEGQEGYQEEERMLLRGHTRFCLA